ncbi:molybdate ABC transporter permease subunit [Caldimonas brevitalea]|uniref:Molybdenum transport system permease n=1 Tax=Caldimonas brevitalea TaxID=413882 RepID=A0A0G3BSF6_9BURK|nr:molybdate ABC transporter permease subunit [Caldimonas brevitalea]AKJ30938.1 molybdate ABC transporter permease [Caldimonas brevitalea]
MLSPLEWEALRLSLQVALASMALCLPMALATAWLLSRVQFPGKSLVEALVHAPLVLPPVVIGYLLLISLGTRAPLGRWLYEVFGLRLIFTTEGAVLAAAVMAFPLAVRAIRLSLEAVDPGLELAARTLGASRWDAHVSVTLPLLLPGLLSGGMMAFAASLGEFGATITFAANIEGETRTLPLAIYTATQTPDGDRTALRLVALSMGLALAALLVSGLLERRARRWLGRA